MAGWITLMLLAAPDAQSEANAHFNRGLQLAGRGDYPGSLAEFQEAYRLAPAWQVLFNLGVVHEKLNEPVQALEAFEAYLAQGGAAVPRDKREQVSAELGALRKQVAEVVIKVEGGALAIEVDGVERVLSGPLYVLPGTHRVVGRRGDDSTRADIEVHRGDRVVVALAIAERAAPPVKVESDAPTVEPAAPSVLPAPAAPAEPKAVVAKAAAEAPERPWYARWYVWATVGVVVVAVATAVSVAETRPQYDVRIDTP